QQPLADGPDPLDRRQLSRESAVRPDPRSGLTAIGGAGLARQPGPVRFREPFVSFACRARRLAVVVLAGLLVGVPLTVPSPASPRPPARLRPRGRRTTATFPVSRCRVHPSRASWAGRSTTTSTASTCSRRPSSYCP